jgi:hypothetical protein
VAEPDRNRDQPPRSTLLVDQQSAATSCSLTAVRSPRCYYGLVFGLGPMAGSARRCASARHYGHRMANRYQYTVVELREGMIGGKMSGDKLEQVLNEHAAQGWQLKAITSVEVKGRVGPGGVEGLLVTFERPVS